MILSHIFVIEYYNEEMWRNIEGGVSRFGEVQRQASMTHVEGASEWVVGFGIPIADFFLS